MASSSARRERLKQAGLCSQCTQSPVPGKSRCQKHLDKANELARRRNAERKTYGLCIRCPKKSAEGHVLCNDCLTSLRRREINWDDKRDKEKSKHQIRQSKGLCKWCENPNVPGRALCEAHLTTERNKVREYRAERKAKGLCWRCDNPARPGGALCQKHREEVTAKERAKSDRGARSSVPSEVASKIDTPPVGGEDDAHPREVRRSQPVMTVGDDGLGVDAPEIANVVEIDGVQRVAC